jgi:hypothetical protein
LDHRRHPAWLLDELPPSDSDHVPSRELEIEVAPPIALERVKGVVGCAPVGFRDQALGGPMKVHLVSCDEPVDHRHWKPRAADQVEESALQLAAHRRWLVGETFEQPAKRTHAATAPCCGKRGIESGTVEEPKDERLLQRTLEHSRSYDGGEVDERAG